MVSKQLQGLENLLSSESIFSSSDCSKGQRGTMDSDRQPLCCDQDMAQVKSWGPANFLRFLYERYWKNNKVDY